ncbi:PH domain-containing protein [Acinetobacter pittii]|uniref:PH domain-containing protein n=1 Tax=Acinetobacter pittii TaxID=48296 RepID=UPI002E1711D7|nr:PH domain-containing protein [Acinetobacter pittii]MEC6391420.1 PH domain-containing protein [Acinetobacter pittii]
MDMSKVYKSSVDIWLIIVFLVCSIFIAYQLLELIQTEGSLGKIIVNFIVLIVFLVIVWHPYFTTKYTINDNKLFIKSGFFSWTVNINQIIDIKPEKSLNASPALSLDRIKITYKKGSDSKTILISPKDKDDFLSLINRKRSHQNNISK